MGRQVTKGDDLMTYGKKPKGKGGKKGFVLPR
jgi:hypothetical protein